MASKEQIFGILAEASGPMSRLALEEKVGESYRRFQTQLDRWVKQELIEDTGEHHYVLTDKGREEALEGFIEKIHVDIPTADKVEGVEGKEEETQATTGTTEFDQFMRLGKNIGVVPNNLIQVVANHVWNGGDFDDLKWVAQALQEMGIRRDLASRWFNSWRSHLKQPMPTGLPHDFLPPEERSKEEKAQISKASSAGKRDYILAEGNLPVKVGDGLGDLDYQDALDLAKLREARGKGDGRPDSPGTMADEVTKIFNAFKTVMGDQTAGKSWVVKPGAEGYEVTEAPPGQPLIIPQPGAAKPSPSFYIDSEGKTTELQPGQPLVIVKEAPRTTPTGQQYLINQSTGEVREVAQGQPIIIKTESTPTSQATPIQLKDKDGNPIILDLSTFIRLEEHKEKQRRDDESHQVKLEIAKEFKGLLGHAQKALANMGEEEG